MKFHNIINEALKSEYDPLQSTLHKFKVPQLEIPIWIENMSYRQEKKFEKLPHSFIHLTPSQGYFFLYNDSKNAAFESNASFTFITGKQPRHTGRSRYETIPGWYDLEDKRHTHPDLDNWSSIKFIVRNDNKTVQLEKERGGSSGNSIINGKIEEPDKIQDALEALVHHNPETDNYKFINAKQKVSIYIEGGVRGLSPDKPMPIYFAALGTEMKEILEKGLNDETAKHGGTYGLLDFYFNKSDATKEAKYLQNRDRLHHVVAIAEITLKDPNLLNKKYGRYNLVDGKSIPPEEIKIVKTNNPDFFKEGWESVKNLDELMKTPLFKHFSNENWSHVFVARSDEEYEGFEKQMEPEKYNSRTGRAKNKSRWQYGSKGPVGLKLKSGQKILMFKPGTTEKEINKLLAQKWFEKSNAWDVIPWNLRQEDKSKSWGYELYFEGKVPDSIKRILILDAFDEKQEDISSWRRPARDLMKRLGRDIKDET